MVPWCTHGAHGAVLLFLRCFFRCTLVGGDAFCHVDWQLHNYHAEKMKLPIRRAEEIPHLSDLGHLEEAVLGRLRHPRVVGQRQLDGGQLPRRRGGRLEAVTTSGGLFLIVVVGEKCHGGDPWRRGRGRRTLLDGPALGRRATARGKGGQQGTPKSGLALQSSEGCGVQALNFQRKGQNKVK